MHAAAGVRKRRISGLWQSDNNAAQSWQPAI
jgi:hypothetical protein